MLAPLQKPRSQDPSARPSGELAMLNSQSGPRLHELDLDWARQCVGWAFSLRAEDVGAKVDPVRWAQLAAAEVNATTGELLSATFAELGEGATAVAITALFARKVLDWCDSHRHQAAHETLAAR